jgi:hypothetical protein
MFYDKYGSQGFLDCRDVGIELDRVDLSRPTATVNGVVNGGSHHTPSQPQRTSGVTMKDARGCGTPYKHLRDPDEVFYEAFGSREPPLNGVGEYRRSCIQQFRAFCAHIVNKKMHCSFFFSFYVNVRLISMFDLRRVIPGALSADHKALWVLNLTLVTRIWMISPAGGSFRAQFLLKKSSSA